MPSEINLDELKALTREAQNAQKEKYQLEAEKIINAIPSKARNAARQGKNSVIICNFKNKLTPDPVAEIVFDWCVKQGLRPTKEDNIQQRHIGYKDEQVEEKYIDVVIHW